MEAYLTALTVVLILNLIVDFRHLFKFEKHFNKEITSNVSIEKYYELKWRLNSIISVIAIVLAVGTYFGINTKATINNDFRKAQDEIEQLRKLISLDTSTVKDNTAANNLLSKRINQQNLRLNRLQKEINSSEIIKYNVKILEEIHLPRYSLEIPDEQITPKSPYDFEITQPINSDTIWFNKLFLLNGEKLPNLTTPPIVQIVNPKVNEDGIGWHTIMESITTQYLVIKQFPMLSPSKTYSGTYNGPRSITLWIFYT